MVFLGDWCLDCDFIVRQLEPAIWRTRGEVGMSRFIPFTRKLWICRMNLNFFAAFCKSVFGEECCPHCDHSLIIQQPALLRACSWVYLFILPCNLKKNVYSRVFSTRFSLKTTGCSAIVQCEFKYLHYGRPLEKPHVKFCTFNGSVLDL